MRLVDTLEAPEMRRQGGFEGLIKRPGHAPAPHPWPVGPETIKVPPLSDPAASSTTRHAVSPRPHHTSPQALRLPRSSEILIAGPVHFSTDPRVSARTSPLRGTRPTLPSCLPTKSTHFFLFSTSFRLYPKINNTTLRFFHNQTKLIIQLIFVFEMSYFANA